MNNKPSYKQVRKNWEKAQKEKKKRMKREGRFDPYDQARISSMQDAPIKRTKQPKREGCLTWIAKYIVANILLKIILFLGALFLAGLFAAAINSSIK